MKESSCRYDIASLAEELDVSMAEIAPLFASYIGEMKSEASDMLAYLSKCDWGMLQRVVHNIKGVSANLNINDVYEGAAFFDALLKQNRVEEAARHVASIIGLLNNAEREIRNFFWYYGYNL